MMMNGANGEGQNPQNAKWATVLVQICEMHSNQEWAHEQRQLRKVSFEEQSSVHSNLHRLGRVNKTEISRNRRMVKGSGDDEKKG
jgi:hypothetical protein